jgi:hypothetical protein
LKKTEIEVALDDYLQENASQFSGEARLQPFYKNRGGVSSPVKREIASLASDIDSKAKSVRRRTLKAAEELGATTYNTPLECASASFLMSNANFNSVMTRRMNLQTRDRALHLLEHHAPLLFRI